MPEFSAEIKHMIWAAAHDTPAVDIRTRVAADVPGQAGVDNLLTSPIILEEFFRRRALNTTGRKAGLGTGQDREAYVASLSRGELADLVWRQLFIDHPPLSEATRVVLTTLGLLGLDVSTGNLRALRDQYEAIPETERLAKILKAANLKLILYPVDSFDAGREPGPSPRPSPFRPVLSLSTLLGDWKEGARRLRLAGFGVKAKIDEFTAMELRRHLTAEAARLNPAALSLDWPSGSPEDDGIGRLVREAVIPLCGEKGIPLILAAGNNSCQGDTGRCVSIEELSPLWRRNPEARFLLVPAHGNQLHSAAREAASARNLLLCGSDPVPPSPSVDEEFLRIRFEALGAAFHAGHSRAERVEELAGRWAHLRWTLGESLIRRHAELWRTGWRFSESDIHRDIAALLGGNALSFLGMGNDRAEIPPPAARMPNA